MKRLLLGFTATLASAAPALAQQLPSPTAWAARAGTERPQGWLTTDDILAATFDRPVSTGTVRRVAAADGPAVCLATVGQVPGCLVLGADARHRLGTLPGGLPYAGRPCALQLSYQLSGPGAATDAPFAQVTLTRTAAGQRQIVAAGTLVLGATPTYTRALVPLQYTSDLLPDSVHVVFSSGALTGLLHAGTTLLVRQVVLGGTASPASGTPAATGLGVFPNPSPDGRFVLDARSEPALSSAALTVSDLNGRQVLAQAAPADGASQRLIDLQGQPAGVYTLELATAQGELVRRLLVR